MKEDRRKSSPPPPPPPAAPWPLLTHTKACVIGCCSSTRTWTWRSGGKEHLISAPHSSRRLWSSDLGLDGENPQWNWRVGTSSDPLRTGQLNKAGGKRRCGKSVSTSSQTEMEGGDREQKSACENELMEWCCKKRMEMK